MSSNRPLSEIAEITMGQSPTKAYVNHSGIGLPLLNGPTEFGKISPTPAQWATAYSKIAREGDLLFCVRGSTGRMNWADQDYAIGRGIASIRASSEAESRFVRGAIELALPALLMSASGSTFPNVSRSQLQGIPVPSWNFEQSEAVGEFLGALDDKIESNMKQRALCRQLGSALVERQAERTSKYLPLGDYCLSISRGVTPKYFNNEDVEPVKVLNQKCIRDGWVSPELARWMLPRKKSKAAAIAEHGDLLVNSTGQGTLGRVGRWSFQESIYVDSHVSVVKHNPDKISPTLFNYLVFPKQTEIEEMAEGSTGQTELTPSRLASLEVPQIPKSEQERLEPQLLALENQAHACFVQASKLAALREALLPELMSGRIRVRVTEVSG